MACHDGLDQTNCNHAACTASRLTDRYLLHVLFCLHMCVCHERRGSFGIDSPETSDEPCHSESLTYHLILSHEVGMHGSTWEVKMHIGIYWMKDNQRVFIPFSPQVQSIELQSDTLDILKESQPRRASWASPAAHGLRAAPHSPPFHWLSQLLLARMLQIPGPLLGKWLYQACLRNKFHGPSWQANAITEVMLRIKPRARLNNNNNNNSKNSNSLQKILMWILLIIWNTVQKVYIIIYSINMIC